jgi:hypothetical protein
MILRRSTYTPSSIPLLVCIFPASNFPVQKFSLRKSKHTIFKGRYNGPFVHETRFSVSCATHFADIEWIVAEDPQRVGTPCSLELCVYLQCSNATLRLFSSNKGPTIASCPLHQPSVTRQCTWPFRSWGDTGLLERGTLALHSLWAQVGRGPQSLGGLRMVSL